MPLFSPPTVADMSPLTAEKGPEFKTTEEWRMSQRLFRHYKARTRGLSVVKISGVYATVDTPTSTQLDAAGGRDGIDFFRGGHIYTVTQAVADALAAAGYTTTADPTPPPRQITWGSLGGGTWHDFVDDYGTWG